MSWLPFYFETKIILLLWLVHSNFAGAKFVYENFVDEVFQKHEVDIDHSLAVCKAQVHARGVLRARPAANLARLRAACRSQAVPSRSVSVLFLCPLCLRL